jgi:NAD(P)H-dependent FMN reductase
MKVQIIMGSTRPGRVSPQIAEWTLNHLPKKDGVEYEIVDVAKYNLPLFDEPQHPSLNQYAHEHTKLWSKKIKEGDSYIFLTAEYNAGYPASLKNAIDYLYHEWSEKPALVISYGVQGGSGASAQLQQVLNRLKMNVMGTSPALTITREMSSEDGQIKQPDEGFKAFEPLLEEAVQELLGANDTDEAAIA